MKINMKRWVALSVAAVMMMVTLGVFSITPAHAGSKGRRNTAIALGAVTAYGLIKKKKKLAIAGAVGTAYAYKRYSNQKKRERNRRYYGRRYYRR